MPGKGRDIQAGTEEGDGSDAVADPNNGLAQERHRKGWEELFRRTGEAYDRAKERVEGQRRRHVRKNTRANRDRYKRALEELAEKRETLRELKRKG